MIRTATTIFIVLVQIAALLSLTVAMFAIAVVLWDSRRPSACECERCDCRALGECVPPCREKSEPVE